MNLRERFLTAVRRGVPDVVPVAPLIHARFAHTVLTHHDLRAVFDLHRLIGSIHFRGPLGVGYDIDWNEGWGSAYELQLGGDGRVFRRQWLHTPRGHLTSVYVYHIIADDPLVGKYIEYPVKEHTDWDIYQAYLEACFDRAVSPNLEPIQQADEFMAGDGVPSVGIGSAFGHVGNARGLEQILVDMIDIPDRLWAVMETAMAWQAKLIDAFLDSPSEITFYDICWATGAYMSPKMFERWVLPDVRQAVERVHTKPGKYIGLYTLGRIRQVLPMLVDAGVDFIETFEPNQGDISLAEAKRLYGDRTCLMGNFDCVVLARGTMEDARREALRCLREGMEGGGYVLVTGDEVPADAKLDNLKAMVETVDKHGRYS
jgi:uroporphyrinogen-III decarboxylase